MATETTPLLSGSDFKLDLELPEDLGTSLGRSEVAKEKGFVKVKNEKCKQPKKETYDENLELEMSFYANIKKFFERTSLKRMSLERTSLERTSLERTSLERTSLEQSEKRDLSEAKSEKRDLSEAKSEKRDLSEAKSEKRDAERIQEKMKVEEPHEVMAFRMAFQRFVNGYIWDLLNILLLANSNTIMIEVPEELVRKWDQFKVDLNQMQLYYFTSFKGRAPILGDIEKLAEVRGLPDESRAKQEAKDDSRAKQEAKDESQAQMSLVELSVAKSEIRRRLRSKIDRIALSFRKSVIIWIFGN